MVVPLSFDVGWPLFASYHGLTWVRRAMGRELIG